MKDLQPCGTYGGYQRHRRRGEDPCQRCREASAAYATSRRVANPAQREKERQRAYARERALSRLAKEFPARYQALYTEEVAIRDVAI